MTPSGSHPHSAARDAAAVAALMALALVAYANSFRGGFVFDDFASITGNRAVHGLRAFIDFGHSARPNRAFAYFTLALNYELGGLDPTGYRVFNFCIHVVDAVLVYALVVLTFRTPRMTGSSLAGSSRAIAFAAAALFVTHPLQTQAVTYVTQRLASLATALYLASVVLYVRWRLRDGARPATRALGYVPTLVTALLAMKTKEIAFTLPFAVALWEVMFFDGRPAARFARLAPLLATLVVIPLTMLDLGKPAGEVLSDASVVTRVQTGMSRVGYLRTELAVVTTYLRLLLLPVGQNVDHDYPAALSFMQPRVLWAIVLIGGLIALAFLLVRATSPDRGERRIDPAARVVAAGILWFFLALTVESSVIPIVDVIYEHRAYLPSVGFFVAIAAAGGLLARRPRVIAPGRALIGAAVALSAVLAIATLSRNRVWADELSLWSDSVLKSPLKSRPHNNVAAALAERGRVREAEAHAIEAIRLDPRNAEAYHNLGRILVEEGRYEASLPLFRDAIRLVPSYADAYANMAGALNRLDRYGETVRMLEPIAPLFRENPPAQFNLGVAYWVLGRSGDAHRQLAMLRTVSPPLAYRLEAFMTRR